MASTPPDGSTSAEPKSLLFAAQPTETFKVAGREGDALGSVYSLMLNKSTGQPTYAVLALGGFLGIGKSYYPLPFQLLSYDHVADGYAVTIDRRILEGGPSWANHAPEFNQAYSDRVANYYGVSGTDITGS